MDVDPNQKIPKNKEPIETPKRQGPVAPLQSTSDASHAVAYSLLESHGQDIHQMVLLTCKKIGICQFEYNQVLDQSNGTFSSNPVIDSIFHAIIDGIPEYGLNEINDILLKTAIHEIIEEVNVILSQFETWNVNLTDDYKSLSRPGAIQLYEKKQQDYQTNYQKIETETMSPLKVMVAATKEKLEKRFEDRKLFSNDTQKKEILTYFSSVNEFSYGYNPNKNAFEIVDERNRSEIPYPKSSTQFFVDLEQKMNACEKAIGNLAALASTMDKAFEELNHVIQQFKEKFDYFAYLIYYKLPHTDSTLSSFCANRQRAYSLMNMPTLTAIEKYIPHYQYIFLKEADNSARTESKIQIKPPTIYPFQKENIHVGLNIFFTKIIGMPYQETATCEMNFKLASRNLTSQFHIAAHYWSPYVPIKKLEDDDLLNKITALNNNITEVKTKFDNLQSTAKTCISNEHLKKNLKEISDHQIDSFGSDVKIEDQSAILLQEFETITEKDLTLIAKQMRELKEQIKSRTEKNVDKNALKVFCNLFNQLDKKSEQISKEQDTSLISIKQANEKLLKSDSDLTTSITKFNEKLKKYQFNLAGNDTQGVWDNLTFNFYNSLGYLLLKNNLTNDQQDKKDN